MSLRDLARPGCVLAIIGALILLIAIGYTSFANREVDLMANPELASRPGTSLRAMMWMVLGVVTLLTGALVSFVEFTRSRRG